MDLDWLRNLCMSFPHATENVQWGNDLVFKVAEKMFAVASLEPGEHVLSFKCTREAFVELTDRPGIKPAPYLARANWVALETYDAVPREELKSLLRSSYDQVVAKLPKKAQAALSKPTSA